MRAIRPEELTTAQPASNPSPRGWSRKLFPNVSAFANLGRNDQNLLVRTNQEGPHGFETAVERLSWLTPRVPMPKTANGEG